MKLAKFILFFIFAVSTQAGVVNNSGATGADSLTIEFYLLDSVGNVTGLAADDSIGLVVFYPEGAVAHNTTILGNNTNITADSIPNIGQFYSYSDAVASFDGLSATDGIYKWIFLINDISLGLKTPFNGEFQLYTSADYHSRLNNLDTTISTRSEFDYSIDSVDARSNLLAVSGDFNAADSLEALVDGESDFQLKLKQIYISNATGSAVYASSQSSNGHGIYLEATQGGNGIYAINTGTGNGMLVEAGSGGDGSGLKAVGKGNGADISAIEFDEILDSIQSLSGSGSSADSSSIARWVWNSPKLNHNQLGTFGDYLDADISGMSVGSGIYSYSFVVIDTTIDQIIPNVTVVIKNLNQSSIIALGNTDIDGTVSFNLDNGTYLVLSSAPHYLFNTYDTLSISATGVDTLYGYPFDPGSPVQPSFCRVYGFIYSFNGEPEVNASVRASLPNGVVQYNNLIISPFQKETMTDSLGYFYIDLIPSDSLIPEQQKYEITITRHDGTILRQRIFVPSVSYWLLSW